MRPKRTIPAVCEQCGKTFTPRPGQVRRGHGRFCSRPCVYEAQRKPVEERFWSKVDRSGECWEWRGALSHRGYGQFGFGQRGHRPAHRVAWILTHGPIPDGLMVLHRCDNRRCVRPTHLFLGTAAENSADMVRKGRSLRGQRQPNAKLTAEQVRSIRERYKAGALQRELAAEFDVCRQTIGGIVRGQEWRED